MDTKARRALLQMASEIERDLLRLESEGELPKRGLRDGPPNECAASHPRVEEPSGWASTLRCINSPRRFRGRPHTLTEGGQPIAVR